MALRKTGLALPLLLLWALFVIAPAMSLAQSIPTDFAEVSFASDHRDGAVIKGYLSRAPKPSALQEGKEPIAIALHGCGGLWTSRGDLGKRYRDYRDWFHERGIGMLLVDSFAPRGKPQGVCTEKLANRSIVPADRRMDVQGAVRWLSTQAWVDSSRLLVFGWSHGGSTTLWSIERAQAWPSDIPELKAAIAFYPGCTPASQNSNYTLQIPLLLMIGEADDWTPAAPCIRFHEQQQAKLAQAGLDKSRFQFKLYPDAHHGFDSFNKLQLRADVPNGVNRGRGVTTGGNPSAYQDALSTMDRFLKQYFF